MSTSGSKSQLTKQLIQGIGVLERLGIIDFNGHCSARLPDGRILINSGASVRSALTPDDFVTVGSNGEIDPDQARPPAELPLHVSIYQTRKDVQSVAHGHPKWSTLLTSAGQSYKVAVGQGALLGDIPVYPSPRSVNQPGIGDEVAQTLGSGKAALLKAHGSVLVAGDILEATVMAIYLELNAERQVLAAPLGGSYTFSPEEVETYRVGLSKRGLFEKCWNYYIAKFGLN